LSKAFGLIKGEEVATVCHRLYFRSWDRLNGASPFLLTRPIPISIDHKNWQINLAVALSRFIPHVGVAEQV